jgi:V8-like Glu-specific endopeptidase
MPPKGLWEPPRFDVQRLPRSRSRDRRAAGANGVTDASRPDWIGFRPEPRGAPRILEPVVRHRGKRLEPISIQGKDDRRVYQDTRYPWVCVCRITSGNNVGSGVLIGPRHVLTASHVIDWNAGWAVVELHRFDASFVSGSCCSRLTAFTHIGDVEYSTVDEDYAVLTLFERLGDRFGWMGSRTYDSAWDDEPWWRTIGYPGDIAKGIRPVYERDFDLDEEALDYGPARAMTCGADLMKGHSGGPIFAFWPDGKPYVVAVVSAGGGDDNYCAGGSWLPELVRKAREADP